MANAQKTTLKELIGRARQLNIPAVVIIWLRWVIRLQGRFEFDREMHMRIRIHDKLVDYVSALWYACTGGQELLDCLNNREHRQRVADGLKVSISALDLVLTATENIGEEFVAVRDLLGCTVNPFRNPMHG